MALLAASAPAPASTAPCVAPANLQLRQLFLRLDMSERVDNLGWDGGEGEAGHCYYLTQGEEQEQE